MKKYMLLLAMLIFGTLLINSCSDSDKSTDNPIDDSPGNFFPSDIGNYWIYMNESTTNDGEEGSYLDSTVITSTETLFGKNAATYTSYVTPASSSTTRLYSTDGIKLYALASSLLQGSLKSLFPDDMLTEDWVTVADARANGNWTAYKKSYKDYSYELNGVNVTITGDFVATGTNKGNIAVQTSAGTFDAVQNDMIISFKGFVMIGFETSIIDFDIVSTVYFSENIGQVKTETKKQSIFMGDQKLFDIPQSSSTLLRYNVAK